MELVFALWGLAFRVGICDSGCGFVFWLEGFGDFVEDFAIGKTPLRRQPEQRDVSSLLSLKLDGDGQYAPEGDVLRLQKAGGLVGFLGGAFILVSASSPRLQRIRWRCTGWDQ
ncbi:hypothetical protein PVAP13_2NG002327 [Panicum virgatum]|uniref:Uncharacterized protein n=1 Tax=Panicum virgatum TaxID=38727 RepID=A0A8T0VA85_PANVG|nr:hypothetical protein PVAP13_2NG002327 [Panicum virgatum]